MAESSFEIDYYSPTNQRRHYPTPVSYYQSVSGSSSFIHSTSQSITPSKTRRTRRNRVPTTPFASDDDRSWQGEVSWKFEPTRGLREHTTNFGSVLSPWPTTTTTNSPYNHSRVFLQSANDYYLSRTSRFTKQSYDHSSNGRVELWSHVARDNNDHNQSRGFSKLEIIKEGSSHGNVKGYKNSPLAEEDELSRTYYSISDELSHAKHDHGGRNRNYHNGIPSYYSNYYDSNKMVSGYDEEGEEEMDEEEEEVATSRTVGLFNLFRYTRKWDWLLVFLGCLGALINGGSLPFYSYLFGDLVNKLSGEAGNDKAQMMKDVEKVLIFLPYLTLVYKMSAQW